MPFDVIDQDGALLTQEDEQTIRVVIVYNGFEGYERELHHITWGAERTLADYLDGLPDNITWHVWAKGAIRNDRDEWKTLTLAPGEQVIISAVPNKQVGQIIGIVATIALAVFQPELAVGLGGLLGVGAGIAGGLAAGLVLVGGLLVTGITAAITAANSAQANATKTIQSASYGLDGPENTSTETIPVPVVYGTMRLAGNKVNVFVENTWNVGSQQYYAMFVVSEGPVSNIYDIQLNGSDIANYQDCYFDIRLGNASQSPMPWFTDTINPISMDAIINTVATPISTTTQVDRLRWDFEFPNGLYNVKSDGTLQAYTVQLGLAYRPMVTGAEYIKVQAGNAWVPLDPSSANTVVNCTGIRVVLEITGKDGQRSTPYSAYASAQPTGNVLATGQTISPKNGTSGISNTQGRVELPINVMTVFATEDGVVSNVEYIDESGAINWKAGSKTITFELTALASQTYNLAGGGQSAVMSGKAYYGPNNLTVSNNVKGAWRFSVYSPILEHGFYEYYIIRSPAQSQSPQFSDEVTLVTCNEISDLVVNYNNTAYYGVSCLLGTDLTGEPQCTAMVDGKILAIYDRDGSITTHAFSNNPADVALDILLNDRNRFSIATSRINFASFDDWRQFCNANSLVFNGCFDTTSNVWDAVAMVMRVGRASPSMSGLRWSVVIEAPAEPVMMITQDMMVKGSFQNSWTGRKDRANLIEIQFSDEAYAYKQNSAFALDNTYLANGDALVQSTSLIVGITTIAQAQAEANLQLNLNRYVAQTVQADVYLSAIGFAVGDVVYFQHDMPSWGHASRIVSVDENGVITLDATFPYAGESDWNMLTIQSAVKVANSTIAQVSGNLVTLNNLMPSQFTGVDDALNLIDSGNCILNPDDSSDGISNDVAAGVGRLLIGTQDYGVVDQTLVGGHWIFELDANVTQPVGTQVGLFRADQLCQTPLSVIDDLHVMPVPGAWSPYAPSINALDRVMLGRLTKLGKPFRITKITYATDHTRTIYGQEYNASVYGNEAQPAPDYSDLSLSPLQCSNLVGNQGFNQLQGGGLQYYALFTWTRPLSDPRVYTGAKIYQSVNGSPYAVVADVPNPSQSYQVNGNVGDIITIKVVAHESDGETAAYAQAPIATVAISSTTASPASIDPSSLTATGGIGLIALAWTLPSESDYIKTIEVWESATSSLTAGYKVAEVDADYYVRSGLDANQTRYYWLRSVSSSGVEGDFVGGVSGTTSYILTADLEQSIQNTAKYAQGLLNSLGQPLDYATLPDPSTVQIGQVIFNEADGKLYQKAADGTLQPMVPVVQVASQVLTAGQLTAIAAAQIDGQLTSSQILSLQAAQISGTLTASQIATITAAQVTGQLVSSQIQSVLNTQIQGQLTASQIASLAATQITGQLTASQIASLAATQITGQLTSTQISSISAAQLTGQITTTQIAPNAITTPLISAGAISTAQLAAGAVTAATIAANTITTAQLAAGAITANNLAANAVTAASIAAGAITSTALQAGSVTTAALAAGSVTANSLAIGSSTNVLQNSTFSTTTFGWTLAGSNGVTGGTFDSTFNTNTTDRLAQGNGYIYAIYNTAGGGFQDITATQEMDVQGGQTILAQAMLCPQTGCNGDIYVVFYDNNGHAITAVGSNSAPFSSGLTQSVSASSSPPSALGSYSNAWLITTAPANATKVSLTIRQYQAGSTANASTLFFTQVGLGLTTANATQPAAWTPGGVTTISGGQLAAGSITTATIAAGTITGGNIAAGTITGGNIAASTITSGQIAAQAITATQLAAGAVTARSIAAGAITASSLAVGSSNNVIWNSVFTGTDGIAAIGGWSIVSSYGATFAGVADGINSGPAPASGQVLLGHPQTGWIGASAGPTGTTCLAVWANSLPAGQAIGLNWDPDNSNGIAATPGVNYAAAVRVYMTGGGADILLNFYDINGKLLTTFASAYSTANVSYPQGIGNWPRLVVSGVAPASACTVTLTMNFTNATSGAISAPSCYWTQAQLSPMPPNATDPGQYTPGGITSISGSSIKTGTLNAQAIVAGTITGSLIQAGTITANNISAYSITGDRIAANTISGGNILANAITTGLIQAGAVTADQIAANQIYGYHMAAQEIISLSAQIGSLVVNTIHVIDEAITTYATTTWNGPHYGSGNMDTITNFSMSVTEECTALLLVSWTMGYAGSQTTGFQISLNSSVIYNRTGETYVNDYPTLHIPVLLQSGSNTFVFSWLGANSNVSLSAVTLTCLSRLK